MTFLLSILGSRVTKLGFSLILAAALGLGCYTAARYLISSWQTDREKLVSLELAAKRSAELAEINAAYNRFELGNLRAEVERVQKTVERRAVSGKQLDAAVSEIVNARRPEGEPDCPTHPAIVLAVDSVLRSRGASGSADRDPPTGGSGAATTAPKLRAGPRAAQP